LLALAAVGVTAAAATIAEAGPSADYSAIKRDWRKDGKITACRFSLPELYNASDLAAANNEDDYTGFPSEIDREIRRWGSRGCSKSSMAQLRLSVSPRSAAKRKSVAFSFTVTTRTSRGGSAGLRGVTVSFAGKRARTNRSGKATLTATFTKAGRRSASATRRGLRSASATISVR
jgi:hypothetical protein